MKHIKQNECLCSCKCVPENLSRQESMHVVVDTVAESLSKSAEKIEEKTETTAANKSEQVTLTTIPTTESSLKVISPSESHEELESRKDTDDDKGVQSKVASKPLPDNLYNPEDSLQTTTMNSIEKKRPVEGSGTNVSLDIPVNSHNLTTTTEENSILFDTNKDAANEAELATPQTDKINVTITESKDKNSLEAPTTYQDKTTDMYTVTSRNGQTGINEFFHPSTLTTTGLFSYTTEVSSTEMNTEANDYTAEEASKTTALPISSNKLETKEFMDVPQSNGKTEFNKNKESAIQTTDSAVEMRTSITELLTTELSTTPSSTNANSGNPENALTEVITDRITTDTYYSQGYETTALPDVVNAQANVNSHLNAEKEEQSLTNIDEKLSKDTAENKPSTLPIGEKLLGNSEEKSVETTTEKPKSLNVSTQGNLLQNPADVTSRTSAVNRTPLTIPFNDQFATITTEMNKNPGPLPTVEKKDKLFTSASLEKNSSNILSSEQSTLENTTELLTTVVKNSGRPKVKVGTTSLLLVGENYGAADEEKHELSSNITLTLLLSRGTKGSFKEKKKERTSYEGMDSGRFIDDSSYAFVTDSMEAAESEIETRFSSSATEPNILSTTTSKTTHTPSGFKKKSADLSSDTVSRNETSVFDFTTQQSVINRDEQKAPNEELSLTNSTNSKQQSRCETNKAKEVTAESDLTNPPNITKVDSEVSQKAKKNKNSEKTLSAKSTKKHSQSKKNRTKSERAEIKLQESTEIVAEFDPDDPAEKIRQGWRRALDELRQRLRAHLEKRRKMNSNKNNFGSDATVIAKENSDAGVDEQDGHRYIIQVVRSVVKEHRSDAKSNRPQVSLLRSDSEEGEPILTAEQSLKTLLDEKQKSNVSDELVAPEKGDDKTEKLKTAKPLTKFPSHDNETKGKSEKADGILLSFAGVPTKKEFKSEEARVINQTSLLIAENTTKVSNDVLEDAKFEKIVENENLTLLREIESFDLNGTEEEKFGVLDLSENYTAIPKETPKETTTSILYDQDSSENFHNVGITLTTEPTVSAASSQPLKIKEDLMTSKIGTHGSEGTFVSNATNTEVLEETKNTSKPLKTETDGISEERSDEIIILRLEPKEKLLKAVKNPEVALVVDDNYESRRVTETEVVGAVESGKNLESGEKYE